MPKTIQLVFWKSKAPTQEPYTTSEVIAEAAGMNRRTVNRLIQTHKADLEEFGRVRFEITPLKTKGVVIGIVRSLDAEEKVDLKDWREFEEKFPRDPLENYYAPKYNYAFAAKKYFRGEGYSCFMAGYDYGFAEGRRAEKAAPRRKRRAAGGKALYLKGGENHG